MKQMRFVSILVAVALLGASAVPVSAAGLPGCFEAAYREIVKAGITLLGEQYANDLIAPSQLMEFTLTVEASNASLVSKTLLGEELDMHATAAKLIGNYQDYSISAKFYNAQNGGRAWGEGGYAVDFKRNPGHDYTSDFCGGPGKPAGGVPELRPSEISPLNWVILFCVVGLGALRWLNKSRKRHYA